MVCRRYEIYEFLFWCYKTKHVGVVVFFLCLSSFLVVFSCEDLATLTLYHTAHERS